MQRQQVQRREVQILTRCPAEAKREELRREVVVVKTMRLLL
jgi:hypothetical protein